jgi:23S rRNA pseudouridine2605 synthase
MSEERLQKIIARAGFASRREAEQMIREGKVTVNGKVVTELGTKADSVADHVKVDGRLITRPEAHRYILLYKPKEVMTTVHDPQGRRTVLDIIKGVKERIFPVGRLDFHSEGLILLTNDGELAFQIAHPKHGSIKTYHVKVRGVPEERLVDKLRRGITIDGHRTLPCDIERLRTTGRGEDQGNSWYDVRLREGRTQQIRKMFKAVGHPVTKLKRVAIGPLSDSKLSAGEWRELTKQEVRQLAAEKEPRAPRPAAKRPPARKPVASKPAVRKKSAVARTKKSSAKKPAVKGRTPAHREGAPPRTSPSRSAARRS